MRSRHVSASARLTPKNGTEMRRERLVAERLGGRRLHGQEALPEQQHGVGVVRADEHVRARDDRRLHAHHHELLQLHVLDHVGVQVGVDESHAWSLPQ